MGSNYSNFGSDEEAFAAHPWRVGASFRDAIMQTNKPSPNIEDRRNEPSGTPIYRSNNPMESHAPIDLPPVFVPPPDPGFDPNGPPVTIDHTAAQPRDPRGD